MKNKTIIAVALLLSFITDIVIGATDTPFKTAISEGLVLALNSVGKNLFGDQMFGTSINQPPDPIESDEVQIAITRGQTTIFH